MLFKHILTTVTVLQFSLISAYAYHEEWDAISPRANTSYLDTLSKSQRRLFEYAMSGLDLNFSPPFLFDSPRYSAWYAVGLLARNQAGDVAVASDIIREVISYQYTDPTKLWFGTFKNEPNAPDPGDVYPPKPYGSYDLNQGLFVCTSWIIAMEEFQYLLDPGLVDLMKRSMYNATIGDGYRVGGVDGDNLYPIYSNPWYMRVMAATYVGNMISDFNMTFWGDEWARLAIFEFDRFGTLSEFNSGTYTGVTLYALSLWGYMPRNSTIRSRAPDIISKTWESVAQYYNPTLCTLGGPWDRSYGFDMRSYLSILGAQITGVLGGLDDGTAPLPSPLIGSEHYEDAAAIALTPLVAKFHDKFVSQSVKNRLTELDHRGHSHFERAASPPFDSLAYPRNYTSWTNDGLSVGAVQVDSNVVGGPAVNPSQFVPAVIQWSAGSAGNGWISHYATSRTISAVATAKNITISYPPSQAFPNVTTGISNIMTFLISGFNRITLTSDFLANGSATLPGLRLRVSGNVAENGVRTFAYGTGTLNNLMYYNLTYAIPALGGEVPELVLTFEKLTV